MIRTEYCIYVVVTSSNVKLFLGGYFLPQPSLESQVQCLLSNRPHEYCIVCSHFSSSETFNVLEDKLSYLKFLPLITLQLTMYSRADQLSLQTGMSSSRINDLFFGLNSSLFRDGSRVRSSFLCIWCLLCLFWLYDEEKPFSNWKRLRGLLQLYAKVSERSVLRP